MVELTLGKYTLVAFCRSRIFRIFEYKSLQRPSESNAWSLWKCAQIVIYWQKFLRSIETCQEFIVAVVFYASDIQKLVRYSKLFSRQGTGTCRLHLGIVLLYDKLCYPYYPYYCIACNWNWGRSSKHLTVNKNWGKVRYRCLKYFLLYGFSLLRPISPMCTA